MRRALQIYHILNLMHILFYLYIVVRAMNLGNARAIIRGNSLYILLGYALAVVLLSAYAKKVGKGYVNPMRTLKWPRTLHAVSIALFVLALLFFSRRGDWFVLVMLLSFTIEIVAFILAYRGAVVREANTELLDDPVDNEEMT